MKGIILAGGSGTRLHPLTIGVSKQLLPVCDKPMIYYPLSVLMLAQIKEILIISTPHDLPNFQKLLGDGSDYGINLSYAEQPSPNGLAEAFIIGKEFIGHDNVCLILGDNIFYGSGMQKLLINSKKITENEEKAIVFGCYVNDPESFGVVEFDENKNIISIAEKPKFPKSNHALVGLYFYPNSVIDIVKAVKPSDRGELEITSINQIYLEQNNLQLQILSRGFAWLDTGTNEALIEATEFVKAIESRTYQKIGCLEEIALRYGWIKKSEIMKKIANSKSSYYKYIIKIINNIS